MTRLFLAGWVGVALFVLVAAGGPACGVFHPNVPPNAPFDVVKFTPWLVSEIEQGKTFDQVLADCQQEGTSCPAPAVVSDLYHSLFGMRLRAIAGATMRGPGPNPGATTPCPVAAVWAQSDGGAGQ